jgi:hypothetical protein
MLRSNGTGMVSPAWGAEVIPGCRGDRGGQATCVFTLASNASSRTDRTRDKDVGHVVEGCKDDVGGQCTPAALYEGLHAPYPYPMS